MMYLVVESNKCEWEYCFGFVIIGYTLDREKAEAIVKETNEKSGQERYWIEEVDVEL